MVIKIIGKKDMMNKVFDWLEDYESIKPIIDNL